MEFDYKNFGHSLQFDWLRNGQDHTDEVLACRMLYRSFLLIPHTINKLSLLIPREALALCNVLHVFTLQLTGWDFGEIRWKSTAAGVGSGSKR